MREPPADEDLLAVLSSAFASPVATMQRSLYRYATSHALEEVDLILADGTELSVIFKDLDWERLLPEAAAGKPKFLHDPRREIGSYREHLMRLGVGPRCYAAVDGPTRHWLFLEKVKGIELWQVGDTAVWDDVAAWLGHFHDTVDVSSAQRLLPWLLARDGADLHRWAEAAGIALVDVDDHRCRTLLEVLGRLPAEEALRCSAPVFLHGELYPSNVLVGVEQEPARIWPIDWEMAATGPGGFDLAALTTGWEEPVRLRMIERYHAARAHPPPLDDLLVEVDRCRLHLAVQWIGWEAAWQAPAEHAHDWVGEALDAAARLGW